MNLTYLMLEARRVLRSPRTLMFTVGMPVLYFFIFNSLYGGGDLGHTGISATAYLMCSMAAFGALMATLFTGGRTVEERSTGWQRQLRLTPLSPAAYLLGKGLVGMLVALVPVLLVTAAGLASGVGLGGLTWLLVIVGTWLSALPFAALGLLIGQLATVESLQVYTMITMLLCGFLGGLWIPTAIFPGWLARISEVLPSYWMADLGRATLTGGAQVGVAVLVLAGWTVVLGALVMVRYRRDGARA